MKLAMLIFAAVVFGLAFAVIHGRNRPRPMAGYDIAIGDHATAFGSYDVAIGDGVSVSGTCQIVVKPIGEETKALIRAQKHRPSDRLVLEPSRIIEDHCGYPHGRIDALVNMALDGE